MLIAFMELKNIKKRNIDTECGEQGQKKSSVM